MIPIDTIDNKQKVAIVVIGYNRMDSITRLLWSLKKAKYPSDDIPLVISIDCSGNDKLYDYVKLFEWPFGDKYVFIQSERLGLRNHILKCGDLTEYFRAVVLFEDDIYVSEYFYDYTIRALDFYGDDPCVSGISLHCNEVDGSVGLPRVFFQDGSDAFMMQSVASWGECWNERMWNGFRQWYGNLKDEDLTPFNIPNYMKNWTRAWSKFFNAYLVSNDKYFVFPRVSLTTNFSEAGTNSRRSSCLGQVNLLMGPKQYHFRPSDKMVKYDIYGTNLSIYNWLGLSPNDLFVDLWGKAQYGGERYVLSSFRYSGRIIQQYALSLRPVELNIRDKIFGHSLFLYDMEGTKSYQKHQTNLPLPWAFYYLREFNFSLLYRYLFKVIEFKVQDRLGLMSLGRCLRSVFSKIKK